MANILSIETSTTVCSVALSKDFAVEYYEESADGPNHASLLGIFVQRAMEFARAHDMIPDAIAVSSGPGSYTGLRIGVSEAKGLCLGLKKPLISVSTLQTMCCRVLFTQHELSDETLFCPMIDARRMEVYTALYDRALQEVHPVSAMIIDDRSFQETLEKHPVVFFGDGAEKCRPVIRHPNARFIPDVKPSAKDMLALAVRAYNARRFEDTAYFVPFYLKNFIATQPKNLLNTHS